MAQKYVVYIPISINSLFTRLNVLKNTITIELKEHFRPKVTWNPDVAAVASLEMNASNLLHFFFFFCTPLPLYISRWNIPLKKRPLLWNTSSVWVALTGVWIIIANRRTHRKPSTDLWLWLFFAGLISPMQLRPNITEFQPKNKMQIWKLIIFFFHFFVERIPSCSDSIKIPSLIFSVCVGGRHFKEAVIKWSRPDETSVMELFL